ncbi:beta-phosphoglucomutase [Paenibacillus albidus]|uniref:beta-phosphoglucomutase n=1 Tax=Paenibacillus albidus TaxID=2041023 RepID=UPI001BEC8E47|nr:beta-phosphoglucomutase [Paenibacillus albidus]MBT2293188.1 beta-phosphoglucomutase [Paenibacillus albidus]
MKIQSLLEAGFKGAIFDLDGVIVDTAKYHYLAWRWLARQHGFDFTEEDNERLKGVSRDRSLEILLEIGKVTVSEAEKKAMADLKNAKYVEYITGMDESELLPGARDYILCLRDAGVKIALGSASKNAAFILEKLSVTSLFDAVIDGTKTIKAKPDPEVFLLACRELRLLPEDCVVFEDAVAGVQAARAAGIHVVGIGNTSQLTEANAVVGGLDELLG